LLVAAVSGFAAWRIGLLLDDELPERVRRLRGDPRVDPRLVDELEQATAAIRRAGEEWHRWRAFADESAKGGETKTQASSPREITPKEASVLLGRTPTRVRQLLAAGRIEGWRDGDGGRWRTTREAVLAFRDCPRSAA
jgi:excisionase family DNA binding protein